jgi:predicted RNA-binding protein Jag
MATQDEYRAKAREALEKLQQQIDELKVQANLAGAEARDRFEKGIDALRKRQSETRAKLDQAADASGDTWKNAAKQMEEAVDSIGDAFSTLADEIDTNLRTAGSAAKAGHKAFLDEWKKQREAREKLIDSA